MERLVPLIYDELRQLADRQMRRERGGHTLQPTALVHEAFMKLVIQGDHQFQDRRHFFCAAARAMRQVLVNHALAQKAKKRGGGSKRIPLEESMAMLEERAVDFVALDDSLNRLSELDEMKGRIVELRFFAGLSVKEIAEMHEVTTRTVERHWRLARAWLKKEVSPD